MTEFSEKLSAYLDGELDPAEAAAVEAHLETDSEAQRELDALVHADALAQEFFEEQLRDPVPFALAQQIRSAKLPQPAAPARPAWNAVAASLVLFVLGGIGGYVLNEPGTSIQTAGWLADVADYHQVYASQGRHLVEVGADEAEHIENWLGKTVGVGFSIPDLSSFDLTFEGGRLLVASGKPVAQLMYRQPNGTVIALCLQRSNQQLVGTPVFREQTLNGFDFVSWSAKGADYVVIGPMGQPDLNAIAESAAVGV